MCQRTYFLHSKINSLGGLFGFFIYKMSGTAGKFSNSCLEVAYLPIYF